MASFVDTADRARTAGKNYPGISVYVKIANCSLRPIRTQVVRGASVLEFLATRASRAGSRTQDGLATKEGDDGQTHQEIVHPVGNDAGEQTAGLFIAPGPDKSTPKYTHETQDAVAMGQ